MAQKRPAPPPVYRPKSTAQPKMSAPPVYRPVAPVQAKMTPPPVYRPQVAAPGSGASAPARSAPPVYRPHAGVQAKAAMPKPAAPMRAPLPPGNLQRVPPARVGAPAAVQRKITLVGPSDAKADLGDILKKHGVLADLKGWYRKEITPGLVGRFGVSTFSGYLNHAKEQYSFAIPVSADPNTLSYAEVSKQVLNGINVRLLSASIEKGHSSIGAVKLLGRSGFSKAIKNSFSKTPVIQELSKEMNTTYQPKQIHLRHFVMGSWFRALPAVIAKAQLSSTDESLIADIVRKLIPRVGKLSGKQNAPASGVLAQDCEVLAMLLHDLVPNLNAGAGPENTIIGFVSNGLSNLAEDVIEKKISIDFDDAGALIEAAIDAVGVVSLEERHNYKTNFKPAQVFQVVLSQVPGVSDPVLPEHLALGLHRFAYQLGMDFMKHQVGTATDVKLEIRVLQAKLLPVGETLYSLILTAQRGQPSVLEIQKFFNAVDAAITEFEK